MLEVEKEFKLNHYGQSKIQPWDYIEANGLDFFEGNVVKYISRWKYKGGIDDLEKAREYITRMIQRELDKRGN